MAAEATIYLAMDIISYRLPRKFSPEIKLEVQIGKALASHNPNF